MYFPPPFGRRTISRSQVRPTCTLRQRDEQGIIDRPIILDGNLQGWAEETPGRFDVHRTAMKRIRKLTHFDQRGESLAVPFPDGVSDFGKRQIQGD